MFTCNLFHIAIYNVDRDSGDRPGSRYTGEAQYIQHEREIQNSTRYCGDCTQEAKMRLPLPWQKLKITSAIFSQTLNTKLVSPPVLIF